MRYLVVDCAEFTYPDRLECGVKPLDFEKLGQIRFLPLERKRFPCFDLALKSLELGDNYSCALNGAGEVAVHAFLQGRIAFTEIAKTMESALDKTERVSPDDYVVLKETDARARALAKEYIAKL